MPDLFDLANLIKNVGVDAVKIKQEPGLPEKSSTEILTELFSTFDADDLNNSQENQDDDSNAGDKSKKRKKKSKKKHKHKEKKHKKKERSGTDSEADKDGVKKKKKHRKKLKRRRNSGSAGTSDSDEPALKIKKEFSPNGAKRNEDETAPETMFDLVQKMVKKDPDAKVAENGCDPKKNAESPKSPSVSKNIEDNFDDSVAPRLPEKSDQPGKPKILIKDLKNSVVYNETVKEVENIEKEKAARVEDGEISDSDEDNRTPTLSPTPPPDSFDLSDSPSSSRKQSRYQRETSPGPSMKKDLRYILKKKEKIKKLESRRSSRNEEDSQDKNRESHGKSSRSRDSKRRSKDSPSKDRKESDSAIHHGNRRDRSRGRESTRTRSTERRHRDRSGERRSTRSRDRSRYSSDNFGSNRSRSVDKHRDRYTRGRSRSKERKERIEIDKKKLLEIARRNAINMIKRGTLPLAQQDKAIAAIQAGGKTVDELIDFCKSLSKSEALGELSSVSSDEGGSESEKGFHHPFLLKERPNSIIMNIRDSKQIPTKTFQERTAESSNQLRLQFPVSSGQQHRRSENEWVDVTPTPPPPSVKKSEPKKLFVPATTPAAEEPFAILPTRPTAHSKSVETPTPEPTAAPLIGPVAPPGILPVAQKTGVFPQLPVENVDIGTIVSQRLAAMRKLRENPNDVEALSEMYHAQSEMRNWAESKQMPGQFTGSTGARVLTPAELTSGYQAWARKDQLTSAQPVSGGMGMALLQKMGWRPGEGLGKNKEGTLVPLQLEVKLDKRGLVSDQDIGLKPGKMAKPVVPTIKTLEGKHPVSLLGEFCSKRKYGAPVYELCFECGPDHKKNFLFKVIVNGIEYKPSVASPNKKQAKAEAAQICLQTLGLLSA
ncbi:protein SON isoform X2 [Diachasma alloeum]|uniref:protein SON isoform X2 n=1 Tax=Diachasma alloeum TaxID=454923 RepID=UPI0007381726|nr:protein SON isoform X2 [Diachasma alloeum]